MKLPAFNTPANLEIFDSYYARWKAAPDSVDASWRAFFEGFELAAGRSHGLDGSAEVDHHFAQSKVSSLIYAYRSIGHTQAHLDPLSPPPAPQPRLALEEFGLADSDLDTRFAAINYLDGGVHTLRSIVESLRETYCGVIGYEYMHMQDVEARRWVQHRIEPIRSRSSFQRDTQLRVLHKLYAAEMFERFLHTRYAGQKRFSLEGAETLIPMLDAIIDHCPTLDIREIVMGMAHRGRLNVLANTLGKSHDFIFEEFSENYIPNTVAGDGDVKYHLGYETKVKTTTGAEIEIRLAANPSHLEAVDAVVQGKARARQRIIGDLDRRRVLPLLIHGDAAFAGQGIVAETLNYSQLPGYRTGGTVHVIVNNQIGFTTSPDEARSSRYCTDIAKMIEAPIFHVNGDHPLEVALVAHIALEFRARFQRDVVIDMYCYRKHGHNETDEPMFTQPVLYQKIAKHPPTSQTFARRLLAEKIITEAEDKRAQEEHQTALEQALERVKKAEENPDRSARKFRESNAVFQPSFNFQPVDTSAGRDQLETVARGLTRIPRDFKINPKIKRLFESRWKAFQDGEPIDWGFAEALAFGTLLLDGTPVRLSGQDSERGTFSHRHSVLYDLETRARYVPLMHLAEQQERFCVYNSTLSEAGVLGFDFGYSLDYPKMLCIWEAQFGDFGNGAQVIIDQFIASSESKWQRVSGIVLLLPHGYEGQGPEHSSARLERFLQLCAEDNMQVCNVTTPAQIFHLLRRQMKREFRKPLVIMSPKSLLRHKAAVSPWSELTSGGFQEILDDPAAHTDAKRLVLCSGKVYYDLVEERTRRGATDTAIVRIEQLYPLHADLLRSVVARYRSVEKAIWCQEESQNMGAWSFIAPLVEQITGRRPLYVGREASASPAVGSLAIHKIELAQFLESTFTV
ncbi:2-oxoglutarate dehydrogenase E1 component [Opitutales bacterium ASA1]|uniref:2-oxoglutarate dehydrogenase E1 component n=1 Tax=Congregicoccus parvus TaxID=3081749 RepID=UPI002B29A71B|nr:2-oxoglutarate dehydrogenase E1 component [Opitutales bacterium ASA1]